VNGLRIIIVDFVPGATRHHRQLFWIEVVVVALVMIPATIATLGSLFEGT
jgi:succinate dehydrogenase / fumarate reductase cytochrome b subunit